MNKIKPFYIEMTEDITDKEVAEVFEKAILKGAVLYEGVEGIHNAYRTYRAKIFKYFGVNEYGHTYFQDFRNLFGESAVELTLPDVDQHLGLVLTEVDSLVSQLNELGYEVELTVKPPKVGKGQIWEREGGGEVHVTEIVEGKPICWSRNCHQVVHAFTANLKNKRIFYKFIGYEKEESKDD